MIISIPIEFNEIEDDGYHLFIVAKVNDKKVRLLIDTGASKTVFDDSSIRKVLDIETNEEAFELSPHKSTGLGTNSMDSRLVTIQKFELGEIILTDYEAVVLPMDNVNEAYRMLEHDEIHGVLGSDILKRFKAIIYYNKKVLKLYSS